MSILSAIYHDRVKAGEGLRTLLELGVPREAITVVARDGEGADAVAAHEPQPHLKNRPEDVQAGKGALIGLGAGAGVGLLFGLAAVMIPGVGPFLAAGALAELLGVAGATVASGVVVGGATGTLAGALTRLGLREPDAQHYAGAVERGGIYVAVDGSRTSVGDEVVLETFRRTGGDLTAPPVPQASADHGAVGVTKHVDTVRQHVSEPVTRAELVTETREVPVGESVADGEGRVVQLRPGETLRIQVVEEELVVQKVPRVTREVVIHAQPQVRQVETDVDLQRERVEVRRVGDPGADTLVDPVDEEMVQPLGARR